MSAREAKPPPADWTWHRETLLALRRHLVSGRGELGLEPGAVAQSGTYDHELALALPADRALALREVEDALRRIERGTYGICEATGVPIARVRLRAAPWRRYTPQASRRLKVL